MCDLQRTASSNMFSELSYTLNSSGNESTVSGIAVTGAPILNALAGTAQDPFFPASGSDEIGSTDQCTSHPTPFGSYHYHIWSPCINNGSTTASPDMCTDDTSCENDFINFVNTNGNFNNGQVIGIARDGHLIYGPLKDDGSKWACTDHDFCNGTFMSDGSYGYVSTETHPYVIGCWGPAANQMFA